MKDECNVIIQNWQMTFQVSYFKEYYFLDLLDDDFLFIKLTYIKNGAWLKFIRHSNSLCVRATREITNHVPISKYHLRFFLREIFRCLCGCYPIKSRQYIPHEYRRYNNYWNTNRESLIHFIAFLEFNSGTFSFYKEIT